MHASLLLLVGVLAAANAANPIPADNAAETVKCTAAMTAYAGAQGQIRIAAAIGAALGAAVPAKATADLTAEIATEAGGILVTGLCTAAVGAGFPACNGAGVTDACAGATAGQTLSNTTASGACNITDEYGNPWATWVGQTQASPVYQTFNNSKAYNLTYQTARGAAIGAAIGAALQGGAAYAGVGTNSAWQNATIGALLATKPDGCTGAACGNMVGWGTAAGTAAILENMFSANATTLAATCPAMANGTGAGKICAQKVTNAATLAGATAKAGFGGATDGFACILDACKGLDPTSEGITNIDYGNNVCSFVQPEVKDASSATSNAASVGVLATAAVYYAMAQ